MPRDAAAETDRTVEVIPALRVASPWRVLTVEPIDYGRLHVTFVDGTAGTVDLRELLANAQGTVFDPLRDPGEFRAVNVRVGAVSWPCGADLAPDAMHRAIRERGVWVVS